MASANQNAVSAKIFIAVVIAVCVQGSTAAPKPGFTGNFNPPQNLGKGLGSLSTISGSQLEGMQLGGVSGLQLVMEPCTILMDHTHGQTEFSVVASGTPTVGVVYTDASGTTQLYNATGAPGSFLVVPPNLLHFISNDACTQATVFAVFNQAVFDVYFYPFTMSFIPENVFQAAYGFSTANDASKLQQQASARNAVLAPLSLECYARCNLNPPAAEPMTAAKSG